MKLTIRPVPGLFTVCQVKSADQIDLSAPFTFMGHTDEEISLVCPTEHVPSDALNREDGWRAFRIQGTLDFSLIGILSRISSILAGEKIGIFAVSTFNTDYILTKEKDFCRALDALKRDGCEIEGNCI